MDSNVEFWKLILNTLQKVYSNRSFIRASIDDDSYNCYCDFLRSKNIKNKIVVFDHKIVFFVDEDLCFSMVYYIGMFYPLDRIYIKIFLHKDSCYDCIESKLFFIPFKIRVVMDKLFKVKPDKDYNRNIDVKDIIVDIINKLVEDDNGSTK